MADVKSTSDVSDKEYLHYIDNSVIQSFIQDISIVRQVHHSSRPLLRGASEGILVGSRL